MKVNREVLELGSLYMAVKDLEMRLCFLWVNNESIVSSNGKAVVKIKHYGVVEKPFYIHRDIVILALKQTRAKTFELSEHSVTCYDKDNNQIMCLSRSNVGHLSAFPKVDSAFPKDVKKSVRFIDSVQVVGILTISGIRIDNKLIPKSFGAEFKGYIGMNDSSLPIIIYDERKDIQIAIMPIIDNFFKFIDEEK